ncbi:MAG: hypothetical protein ABL889_17465 [Terricaulis sp.]
MIDIGFDRYDRNARLKPALLALLPLMLLTAVWLKDAWATATALLGLVIFCGLILFLSRIARQRGRAVQAKIENDLGGLPTTIALRRRDTTIDPQTKERYYKFFSEHGHQVPTADEEKLSGAAADLSYRACVTWLLEQTRDKRRFRMIADENIDYGFRRNLFGLRNVAISVALFCIVINSVAIVSVLASHGTGLWTGIVLEAVLAMLVVAWIAVVTPDFVRDAAWSYATRLLAACDILSAQPAS